MLRGRPAARRGATIPLRTASGPTIRQLTALEDVLATLASRVLAVEVSTLTPGEAIGGVLADDLVAPHSLPSCAVALRPGYAVAAAETVGASPYGPVRLSGVPVRLSAGDLLPDATDAIAPDDTIMGATGSAEIVAPVAPGHWTRRRGEDVETGTLLRKRGAALRAIDAAVAMMAGIAVCTVRRPRLAVAGDLAGEAAIAIVTEVALRRGAEVTRRPDGQALLPIGADLLVLVETDLDGAAERIAAAGGEIRAAGLALRPGEDTVVGILAGAPVVAVRAEPASALAVSCALLEPLLDRLSAAAPLSATETGPLARKLTSTIGLAEMALLRRVGDALDPVASADLTLSALSRAESWCIVPPDSEGWPAGAHISVNPL